MTAASKASGYTCNIDFAFGTQAGPVNARFTFSEQSDCFDLAYRKGIVNKAIRGFIRRLSASVHLQSLAHASDAA